MSAPSPDYEVREGLDGMDLDLVHAWLSLDAYWALGRTREAVATAAGHSLNFGAYDTEGRQVAYTRVVTDHACFAWLCDVYVAPDHRGRGLGSRLVAAAAEHLDALGVPRTLLKTADAHAVYAGHGFEVVPDPDLWMVRFLPQGRSGG